MNNVFFKAFATTPLEVNGLSRCAIAKLNEAS